MLSDFIVNNIDDIYTFLAASYLCDRLEEKFQYPVVGGYGAEGAATASATVLPGSPVHHVSIHFLMVVQSFDGSTLDTSRISISSLFS